MYRRSPQWAVGTELPELQTTWNHGLSKVTGGKQQGRPFTCYLHGWSGRIPGSECLRTITDGIAFKASELINRMPKPARPGTGLFSSADSEGRWEGAGSPR